MSKLTAVEERIEQADAMTPAAQMLERIRRLVESGQLKTESAAVSPCAVCYGTGFEVVPEKGARACECRRPAIVAQRLMKMPPRYAGATLENLYPRPELHPGQAAAIEFLKAHPAESYVFCGKYDTGKTHLFWSLYNYIARDLTRRVVACSMLQLINQYREAFKPREDSAEVAVEVRPNDLMQSHTPYSLFFDDIDKPKLTEYVAEQVHALFDAAYINKHQIVVTTNLSPDRLAEHFDRADDRYGGAIVRRIVHAENNLIEFF